MKKHRRPLAALVLLLAACACSPAGETPAREETSEEQSPSNMKRPGEPAADASAKSVAPVAPKQASTGARRCGWLHNPTPGNWWLVDRDGQWVLGSQGSEPAPGMHEMPDMSAGEWVETNGHYGHGCACMTISADPATGRVTRVSKAEPKPLAQCRADGKLPDPDAG